MDDGENIHNEQLKQAQETFNTKYREVNVQNNNLIAENAKLTKKIEDYQNANCVSEIDKKLKDALEKENKYKEQYEKLKLEKEEKISQLKIRLAKETENHKKKLEELEFKIQEYEGKRNDKNAEFNKQKAVSDKDNENKIKLIQQLNQTLERLKRENEKLTSENKEAQRENENYRKSSRNSSRGSSNVGVTYIPRRRNGGSTANSNKENANYFSNQGEDVKNSSNMESKLNQTMTKRIINPLNNSILNNNE